MKRFGEAFRALLHLRGGWIVCGEAKDGPQAVEGAKSLCPAFIVMDVPMPNMNGLEATRIMHERPETRVLIIARTIRTSYDGEQSCSRFRGKIQCSQGAV
jgi:CheY-like chemotaxis protein